MKRLKDHIEVLRRRLRHLRERIAEAGEKGRRGLSFDQAEVAAIEAMILLAEGAHAEARPTRVSITAADIERIERGVQQMALFHLEDRTMAEIFALAREALARRGEAA